VLAGCGSSSKSSSSSGGGSTQAAGGAKAAGAGANVEMKNIQFVPASITVKAGQTINWKNNDAVAHTVTATGGAKFDSGTVNAGGTYKFVPTKAGTIQYMCTIHPNQKGTITVTK
jgi:plastocyanin